MKRLVFSFIASSVVFLMSCDSGENGQTDNNVKSDVSEKSTISCLDFAVTEKYNNLDPIKITDIVSFHVASQIMEPLLRFNEKDLSLQPLVAESWTISEDDLVYTLLLKKGVKFHDNICFTEGKGRELTAYDVVYTFKRIYSEKSSYAHSLFKNQIKGSENYVEGDIEGLKAIDDYTIEFILNKPSSNFLNILANITSSIVAKEAIEKNEIIGTGPFLYSKENDIETKVTLLRNANYYMSDKEGNQLPYLESVAFNLVNSGQDQLDMFMNEKLDIITGIPPEAVKELVESQIADFQDKPTKYVLGRYPEVTTSYLSLNTATAPFDNKKVRQALGMAINKSKIVDNVLKGEAYSPGNNGIVPSAIKGYDFSSIVGLEYNLDKAKKLLKEAGFPNGKDFPTITFASLKRNTDIRVALEIQKQLLSNLNINVEISSLSLNDMNDMNSRSEINMYLGGWLGEFPGPITFLSLFYGADVPDSPLEISFPNESRYKNYKFDKIYEEALITVDATKRFELCLIADQMIATDVPVIPLWYHEKYQLIQSVVSGYQANSMNIQYLTYVKIETAKMQQKAH
jgi:oligopeptide transport system substrate-binding protein